MRISSPKVNKSVAYLSLVPEHGTGVTKDWRAHLTHLLGAPVSGHSLGVIHALPGDLRESKAQWNKLGFGLQLVLADFSAPWSPTLFMYKMGTRGLLTIVVLIMKII